MQDLYSCGQDGGTYFWKTDTWSRNEADMNMPGMKWGTLMLGKADMLITAGVDGTGKNIVRSCKAVGKGSTTTTVRRT